jgi:hypothetical protein
MKTFLVIFFVILFGVAFGQNYQCVQPNVKRYYINGDQYLRAMSIDSVHVTADTTVCFPFHTARGFYPWGTLPTYELDTNGASWLGKEIVQTGDGTFYTKTMWGDTVFIKTRAEIGDSWIFYNDTTERYYKAELIGKTAIFILDSVDSVKRIQITAYDDSGMVASDPANNLEIHISKHHGFYKVIDLFTFPYHMPGNIYTPGIDYYLDKICQRSVPAQPSFVNSVFTLVRPYSYPTYYSIQNFSTSYTYEYSIMDRNHPGTGSNPYAYMYITIGAQTISSGTVTSEYSGWVATQQYTGTYIPDFPYPYVKSAVSGTMQMGPEPFTDSAFLPEQVGKRDLLYYNPDDTAFCLKSGLYGKEPNNIVGGTWYNFFDSSGIRRIYKQGFPVLNHNWYKPGTNVEVDSSIIYSKRGKVCGKYLDPTRIDDLTGKESAIQFEVFPNPAVNKFRLVASEHADYECTIITLDGRSVRTFSMHGKTAEINTSEFVNGIYTLHISCKGEDVFDERIVISK